MNMKEETEKVIRSTPGDALYTVVDTAVSLIPGIGGLVSEIFHNVLQAPIEKRKEAWRLRIAQNIDDLTNKIEGFDIVQLSQNDIFISVLNRASQLAISNHQEEKLIALNNAIMNTALNIDIDENEQMLFLNIIDSLTPWHIKIMQYLEHPRSNFENAGLQYTKKMKSTVTFIQQYYPELKDKNEFVKTILKDLYTKGLIESDNVDSRMDINESFKNTLTYFGKKLLRYISEPIIS